MMDNPKFKAALMGGGLFGVAAGLPYIGMVNIACCALYIGGGVLAASTSRSRRPSTRRPMATVRSLVCWRARSAALSPRSSAR